MESLSERYSYKATLKVGLLSEEEAQRPSKVETPEEGPGFIERYLEMVSRPDSVEVPIPVITKKPA